MHPGLAELFQTLRTFREQAGMTQEHVAEELVLGPGWIEGFESGTIEPSIGTLVALTKAYGTSIQAFFSSLDTGESTVALDRHLSATSADGDLVIHFPMGAHRSSVRFPQATVDEFNGVLLAMRDKLAAGDKRGGIVECFLAAVQTWPHVNPSDIWYFLVSHAYQDPYNHPASEGNRDFGQSWKRAGGWALEKIFASHYSAQLEKDGIWLEMPEPDRKQRLLQQMGVMDAAGAQKSDVLLVGNHHGTVEAFGVVHVKASFAERRTDDVPLSQQLMQRGYASPLLTMDCKASPSPDPVNRGELGPVQSAGTTASAKRLDIERDRKFEACFSYNERTKPTPPGSASARIYVCSFRSGNDPFVTYVRKKWAELHGL